MALVKSLLLLIICLLLAGNLYAQSDPEIRARRLLNALGCKGCHKLEGDGGTLGPPLDQVGSRLTRKQIEEHLAAHASQRGGSIMPSFSTTPKEDLKALSDFLYNIK